MYFFGSDKMGKMGHANKPAATRMDAEQFKPLLETVQGSTADLRQGRTGRLVSHFVTILLPGVAGWTSGSFSKTSRTVIGSPSVKVSHGKALPVSALIIRVRDCPPDALRVTCSIPAVLINSPPLRGSSW